MQVSDDNTHDDPAKSKQKNSAHQNRLAYEKSPYLLQHAGNPVDWYPWGDEAFEKARKENKPIFLSIGYSTCHWCHVMEHESFEDSEVAALMNEVFVSIKVDREERPDIDGIYMEVCQMITGGGGWPLTIVMTPDKKPFYAATYIPKHTMHGRVGMMDLIPRVKDLWENKRDPILADADKITSALQKTASVASGKELGESDIASAFSQLESRFDARNGGFGGSPKFPTPHNILFLLRYWKHSGDKKTLMMVERTLDAMRGGGIYDHVGFGFHRYSTDAEWLVPHFEKMLYDQALLAMAYTEAYQATGKERYAETTRNILTYVLRDMTAPEGAFYSAEDADSEGEEGRFYLWTEQEIRQVLGDQDAGLSAQVFNSKPGGNFNDESTGQKSGANILHLNKSLPEIAEILNMPEDKLDGLIEDMRKKLFDYRKKRIRPGRDDKILTDWNGLMISAFAKAAKALDEPGYAKNGALAADFILNKMRDDNGRLFHRYRDGQAAIPAYADDYAFFIMGLLDLYEATFEVRYLKIAIELNNDFLTHFWDDKAGGFFLAADDSEKLLVRSKEIYDGAVPSANSVAAQNLLRLSRITTDAGLEEKVVAIGKAFADQVKNLPSAHSYLMTAVEFGLWDSFEVVIAGNPEAPETKSMLKALEKQYLPNKVVLLRPATPENPEITEIAPFTKFQLPIDGKPTAYVCMGHACKRPTTDVGQMLELLK